MPSCSECDSCKDRNQWTIGRKWTIGLQEPTSPRSLGRVARESTSHSRSLPPFALGGWKTTCTIACLSIPSDWIRARDGRIGRPVQCQVLAPASTSTNTHPPEVLALQQVLAHILLRAMFSFPSGTSRKDSFPHSSREEASGSLARATFGQPAAGCP